MCFGRKKTADRKTLYLHIKNVWTASVFTKKHDCVTTYHGSVKLWKKMANLDAIPEKKKKIHPFRCIVVLSCKFLELNLLAK